MIVRDDYQCTGCGEERSCFIFQEFMLPIALCMECYLRMKQEREVEEPMEGSCLLCDTRKDNVRAFKARSPILLRGLLMCERCWDNLNKAVEEQHYL